MKRRRVLFIRLSQFKIFIRKFLIVVLFVSALAFMMLSKADSFVLDKTTGLVSAAFNPVIRIMRLPAELFYAGYEKIRDISFVYQQNQTLKKENLELLLLKNKVRTLEAENRLLGALLHYAPPADASYLTAKVIAEEGDGFSHSLVAYAQDTDQIKIGQVVLGGENVVGRVEGVNGRYIRILLVTDINSKIPVIVERSRVRGILSGDNTIVPKLLFTALNADIKAGDMLVTSGVAGIFPAGLPVGIVKKIDSDTIEVETAADLERLEYVHIVDYGLYNDILNTTETLQEN